MAQEQGPSSVPVCATEAGASWTTTMESPPVRTLMLIDKIFLYGTPPTVFLGIVGNLLSVVVFQCTKLRRLSTSCYLTVLSLSDTGFLLTMLATWLELVGISTYNRPVLCEMLNYLSSVCSFLSPWLIVTFTVERFVATCYPLHRAVVCTVARAKAVVAILTLTAALSYIYMFIMAGQVPQNVVKDNGYSSGNDTRLPGCRNVTTIVVSKCILKDGYADAMKVLNVADTVVTLVVPIAIIVVLNVMIARAIWHFELVRRRMMTTSPSVPTDDCNSSSMGTTTDPTPVVAAVNLNSAGWTVTHGAGPRKRQRSIRGQYQMKITKMLFVISSVFIGLNAPSYVMRLWVFFGFDHQKEQWFRNAQQWCQLWFYLSFAINFLLYCVSGQNFRKSLRSLFRKVTRGAWRRNLSRRNTSTTMTNSAHVWMATAAATPVTGMPSVTSHACLFSSFKGTSGFTEVVLTRNDSL